MVDDILKYKNVLVENMSKSSTLYNNFYVKGKSF